MPFYGRGRVLGIADAAEKSAPVGDGPHRRLVAAEAADFLNGPGRFGSG